MADTTNNTVDLTSVKEELEKQGVNLDLVAEDLEAQGYTFDLAKVTLGVSYLTEGYIDYAREVIANRALPNVYDGLKPVNRRILVTFYKDKKSAEQFIKCARLTGNVLALHPHGDAAVYAALVLMTDKNGSLAFPSVEGSGNFGGVYKDDPPAASRYTEAKLSKSAEEYFGEMDGVNIVPNFDSTTTEPEVLPVNFPAVLVNATSGIAVGFRSNMPSFNFTDVCNLVTEYIDKGHCETVIYPDFVTGGYYVKNDKELQKLMRTGSAKLKLRGKATVAGKEIQVTEVPFGKTIQGIIKQINDKNIPSIRNAYDTDDFEHGCGFTVDCTNKQRVQEAQYALYRDTDFQYTYSADMTVVKDGVPVKMGVWDIIKVWTEWRKEVLRKAYYSRIEGLRKSMRESKAFMTIINSEHKEELIKIITTQGKDKGRLFVREKFTREEVPEDLISWVCDRSISAYHTGGKYATEYATAELEMKKYSDALMDLGAVIKKQMQALIKKYGARLPRMTEVTNVDYAFETQSKQNITDNSTYFYGITNGFIKKCIASPSNVEFELIGKTNDVIMCLDNRGRILRVYGDDLPLTSLTEMGQYIPRLCNLDEKDDYKITYACLIRGQKLMMLYKDGNVGFIDTNEWIGNNRKVKVIENGINKLSAPLLGKVFDVDKLPEYIMATDSKGRIGYFCTTDLKEKNRTARTRVLTISGEASLDSYAPVDDFMTICSTLRVYAKAHRRMCKLKPEDFTGNPNIFIPMD